MPEVSDRSFEEFVVEQVTDLSGSSLQAAGRHRSTHLLGRLWKPGVLALAEGLALLGCFCFPWYVRPDLSIFNSLQVVHAPPSVSYPGWITAIALPTTLPGVSVIFAPQLLLIPLCALALFVTAWFYSRQHVTTRLASGMVLALSVLALLISLSFYVEMASEEAAFEVSAQHQVPIPFTIRRGAAG